jgi:hypothetical protein
LKRGKEGFLSVSKSVTQIKMENEPSQKLRAEFQEYGLNCKLCQILYHNNIIDQEKKIVELNSLWHYNKSSTDHKQFSVLSF